MLSLTRALMRAAKKTSPACQMDCSIWQANALPTILATFCQSAVTKDSRSGSKKLMGADTSLLPSITRSGAFSVRSCRQRSRQPSRMAICNGSAKSHRALLRISSGDSPPRLMAKTGRRGGPLEILTSVRSTISQGSSPSRQSHSRKPAYSIAYRRDIQATLRCCLDSDSFQNLSAPGAISSQPRSPSCSGVAGQPVNPNSCSIQRLRSSGSARPIGPKLRSSGWEMTGSSLPRASIASRREAAPDSENTT